MRELDWLRTVAAAPYRWLYALSLAKPDIGWDLAEFGFWIWGELLTRPLNNLEWGLTHHYNHFYLGGG